jgi:hypothetical protein
MAPARFEHFIVFRELAQNLGYRHGIGRHRKRQRTDHLVLEAFEARTLHGTPSQRVFHDAQINLAVIRFATQRGHLGNAQPTILGQHGCLGTRQLLGYFGDNRLFLI